jgi:hypothetical protein
MNDDIHPPAAEALEARLRRLEEELFSASARATRCAQLLADEFVEFGGSGRVYGKADVIAALQNETPARISAEDFSVDLLAPGVALVTYRALRHSQPPVHSLRSSIWQRQGEQWRMVFHQGTIVPAAV